MKRACINDICKFKLVELIKTHTHTMLIMLFAFVCTAIHSESIGLWQAARLIFSEVFFIYIPGRAVIKRSYASFNNEIVLSVTAYAIGYVLSIISYALLLLCNIQQKTLDIFLIIALASGISLFRKNTCEVKKISTKQEKILYVAVMFIAIGISIIVFYLPNRSAIEVGYRNMNGDLTYWFKNCVSATKGYPLPELSIKGLNLFWHVFSCFEIAFLHYTTGIEIYNLCFTFSFIWKVFLLTGAIYILSNYYLKNNSSRAVVVFATLFASGIDTQTRGFYQYHLYRCSLGFEEGYAISMIGLFIFLQFIKAKEHRVTLFFLTVILLASALGLKASAGAVLLVGMVTRCICEMSRKGSNKLKLSVYILCFCLVFLVVSKMFIIDNNALVAETSSHHLRITPFGTLLKSGNYTDLYTTLRDDYFGEYMAYIIASGWYLMQASFVFIIPLILSVGAVLIERRWQILLDMEIITLMAMAVSGLTVFWLIDHPGFSQVYFFLEIFAFTIVLAMMILEKSDISNVLKKSIIGITTSMIIVSIMYNCVNWKGQYILKDEEYKCNFEIASSKGNDISDDEVIGLRWVRDNLPQDAVLVTNKILFNSSFRSFVTSEYSERQVYIEGWGSTNLPSMEFVEGRISTVKEYYLGDNTATVQLKNEGVTHAILFKGSKQYSFKPNGTVLYSNKDIEVIEL